MRRWPVAALRKVVLPCLSACLCTGWNAREQQLTYYSAISTRVSPFARWIGRTGPWPSGCPLMALQMGWAEGKRR